MFPRPIQKASPLSNLFYQISIPLTLLIWLIPMFAIVLTSIRPAADITAGNYWGIPSAFNFWGNYSTIFVQSNLDQYLLNSLKVTIPTVVGTLTLSCMTGYALSVYRFKGNMLVFFMFIAGNFIPFQILMIPVRDLTVGMDLYNTATGLVLFHVAFQTGFCTLFMRNFIRALPRELVESARIEGVSEYRIFIFVILPLVRPAIAALAVLVFTFIWNDFFWATVLTQSASAQPITAGLLSLNGQWVSSWHLVSAGAVVAALPPVAMFFLMQKQFIAGLTLGAVK